MYRPSCFRGQSFLLLSLLVLTCSSILSGARGASPEQPAESGTNAWAFQVPQRQPLSAVRDSSWTRTRIDAFILAQLEARDLQPNPPADRQTLIRRASFDLTGLPPTPEQVRSFLADDSPEAYERLVDRLLSSPQFGERWTRLWLDVARYAEDQAHIVGNDKELFYPNAYLYRDWVIGALNDDMPYDRFVRLQLAADHLPAEEGESHQAALGFIGLGPKYYARRSPEVMADEWEDRVDTVTRGLLGLTVACARCHDHKYDPIPTEDYYALAGVFASTEMFNRPLSKDREVEKDGQAEKPEDSMHIVRDDDPRDLHVFIRGDVDTKGPVVPRRFLSVLSAAEPRGFDQGSGRLELADAIVSPDNPLTARVLVNRIWGHVFGQPLVGTPSNFGSLGQPPSHPELLDDLSVRFMDEGWSLKWLLRELVLSASYRQSSQDDPAKRVRDPENQWLWRMRPRRLDVEGWRDAILFTAGNLDSTVGGPSIDPADPAQRKRTVYSEVSRLELNSMLAAFDFPDPNAHSERRVQTTTPLQKLFMLNSPFMLEQAEGLAARICSASEDYDERIRYAYWLAFGRDPLAEELLLAREFIGVDEAQAEDRWWQYAQALLASNEMLIVN